MEFNFSDVHEAIARAIPEREALVFRDRRFTYGQVAELAGLGRRAGHEQRRRPHPPMWPR